MPSLICSPQTEKPSFETRPGGLALLEFRRHLETSEHKQPCHLPVSGVDVEPLPQRCTTVPATQRKLANQRVR